MPAPSALLFRRGAARFRIKLLEQSCCRRADGFNFAAEFNLQQLNAAAAAVQVSRCCRRTGAGVGSRTHLCRLKAARTASFNWTHKTRSLINEPARGAATTKLVIYSAPRRRLIVRVDYDYNHYDDYDDCQLDQSFIRLPPPTCVHSL